MLSQKRKQRREFSKVTISYFSTVWVFNNEPWDLGHVSPNYSSLNIYIA